MREYLERYVNRQVNNKQIHGWMIIYKLVHLKLKEAFLKTQLMKPESMVWQSYDSGHRRDPHMSQLFSVSRCSLGFVQDPERGKPTVAYLRSLAQMWSSIYIYYHNEYVQICAHVTHMHTCSIFEASGISLTVSYCGGRGAICINKLDLFHIEIE